VLESDATSPTRYGPGDVIFFRDGAQARWHVEGRVRKLAFCRTTQPFVLGFAARAFNKIKRVVFLSEKRVAPSLASI
jgi:uncharacterized protein